MSPENFNFSVRLALPVIPLEAAIRVLGGVIEQLPQPTEVVLLPSLLGPVHVGHVDQTGGFRLARLRPLTLLPLGSLGAFSLRLCHLGRNAVLFFGIPG